MIKADELKAIAIIAAIIITIILAAIVHELKKEDYDSNDVMIWNHSNRDNYIEEIK